MPLSDLIAVLPRETRRFLDPRWRARFPRTTAGLCHFLVAGQRFAAQHVPPYSPRAWPSGDSLPGKCPNTGVCPYRQPPKGISAGRWHHRPADTSVAGSARVGEIPGRGGWFLRALWRSWEPACSGREAALGAWWRFAKMGFTVPNKYRTITDRFATANAPLRSLGEAGQGIGRQGGRARRREVVYASPRPPFRNGDS